MVAACAALNRVTLEIGPQVGIALLVLAVWSVLNLARVDQQGTLFYENPEHLPFLKRMV